MAMTEPHATRRFRTTVPYYRAGRPAYGAILIRRVAQLCGLGPNRRVLDLGCGPGLLSAAFASFAGEVIAMDPEPDMLAAVAELGIANVHPVPGSSFDLAPGLGAFRLVTMGRSFHWMDRPETLRRLDGLVEPGGAVALFDTEHPDLPDNTWTAGFRALRRRYEGAAQHPARPAGWVRHEGILLDSPFRHLEALSTIERRRVSVESLAQRGLSMSGTSRERLGQRADDFVREIEALLAPFAQHGSVVEVIETRALIGFRPGEAPA
jgi:SAM-dependent methyltransferase